MKFLKLTNRAAIMFVVIALTIFGTQIYKSIQLERNCSGYLKRAADANTIQMAENELVKTISYLEANNLTTGYTSAIYNTPDEDIAFWYNNLKVSHEELTKLGDSASSLEKSNMLIKLRETLLDHGQNSENITMPDGLSRFPNNLAWFIANCVSLILLVWVFVAKIYNIDGWFE